MTNNCTICQNAFEVSAEEKAFHEKISPIYNGKKYNIPAPTMCPECRCQRRLSFRNERKLYPGECDSCQAKIISMFHPSSKYTVYCHDCYYSDKWDAESYGRDFDFTRPFFEQFNELNIDTPQLALNVVSNENATYVNLSGYNKDCYLLFAGEYNENVNYADNTIKCNTCMDTSQTFNSEIIYDSIDIEKCYNVFFSRNCKNCTDSMFLFNCVGCSDCIFSTNLRKKKYVIGNKQYTKDEYEIEKNRILEQIKSYEGLQEAKKNFAEMIGQSIHRSNDTMNAQESTGNNLVNTKKCKDCFNDTKCEDLIYVWDGFDVKDVVDVNNTTEVELSYNATSVGYNSYNVSFSFGCWTSSNVLYSGIIKNCKNLFGCANMVSNSYCILNKQYKKGEYEVMVGKIIDHMMHTTAIAGSSTGEWGEFFPASLSPFGFNESVGHEYFPLKMEEAVLKGFNWANHNVPELSINTISAKDVPANVDNLPDNILDVAIKCEVSGKPFKITKQEVDFYRKHKLPLPRRHPDQRHSDRFKLRNPRKLWDRQCAKCSAEIQTTYAPNRSETVYCEKCYLEAVY